MEFLQGVLSGTAGAVLGFIASGVVSWIARRRTDAEAGGTREWVADQREDYLHRIEVNVEPMRKALGFDSESDQAPAGGVGSGG